ncbi:MAG: prepilin peptidase [Anaerolineales bacterium]|nr:prepilin peptidase [Anaerolineales bacterium]
MILPTILYALLGWLVALAINHAADILPKRETLLQWPVCSACGTRRAPLTWSVWLALLTGRRTCARCDQPRPTFTRSLVVEVATPLFFVFLINYYGVSAYLILVSLYTAILILITVTDLEHRLIFNVVILPSILLAIAGAVVADKPAWPVAMVGGGAAFVVAYLAALLSRGGLGEGDVTLSAFLGLIIGFPFVLLSLGFGVFLGGFVAALLLVTRRVGLKTFIPYGPFLTITGWIMLIWGAEIWAHYF